MGNEKYKLIEGLYHMGLLKDTRFSWVKNNTNKNLLNKWLLNELNIDVDNFKPIQLEDDVMYGTDLVMEEYLYTINPKWYYKSKVNIISETMLYPNLIHLTEKTWKAIYLGIPFVIYAPSRYYLKTLRDMGFKTFNSVIDESYDEMRGGGKITQILIINCKNIVINYNKPVIGFFISKSKIIKLNENITNNTDITYEFSNSYNIDVNQYYRNNNIFIIIYCDEIFINKRSIFVNFFDSCCLIINNNITYF
jgi:hypothetical protein